MTRHGKNNTVFQCLAHRDAHQATSLHKGCHKVQELPAMFTQHF